jgi:arthrofactin-type cyclic lipopeptide synthetase C
MKLAGMWELAAERPLDIHPDVLAAPITDLQMALLHERLVSAGLMPSRSRPEALAGVVRTFEAALRTGYQPGIVYPGPTGLVLLHATAPNKMNSEQLFAASISGWQNWAPNLEVWRGPGNHMTALKLPHVMALGDWVRSRLLTA